MADLLQRHPELARDWLQALERLAWVVKALHTEPTPADPAVVADKARILKTVQADMEQFFTSV